MDYLLQDIEIAVKGGAWYSAAALALAIPDICAGIDSPSEKSGPRYKKWARRYFVPLMHGGGRTFFSEDELYRLRCKFLHEGDFNLFDKSPADSFDPVNVVQLVVCPMDVVPSRAFSRGTDGNGSNSFTVSVTELCLCISKAVRAWLVDANQDVDRLERMRLLPRIEHWGHDGLPIDLEKF